MFKKIRRSLREHKTRPVADHSIETDEHICHACGQRLRQPGGNSDDFAARPYELYEPTGRDSWSPSESGFSDSGYGSFSSSRHFDSMLQLGGTQSGTRVEPSARRSTYTTSIYSDDDHFEELPHETTAEPAHMNTPEYEHLFDVSSQPSKKTSQRWKPRSRYAKLNELPVASPGVFPYQYDGFAASDASALQENNEPEKKRRTLRSLESLSLRPSQFGRLASRRMRFE